MYAAGTTLNSKMIDFHLSLVPEAILIATSVCGLAAGTCPAQIEGSSGYMSPAASNSVKSVK
jgi:hypothetical protein